MSKKSAVRAFGLKLAAVAVAVAGVLGLVGTAWAGPSGVAGPSATANFSTEVDFDSKIDWVSEPSMSLEKFARVDVLDKIGGTAGDLVSDPGNVGILKINTNGSHFDIYMSSRNGGKLATPGDSIWTLKPTSTCTPNWDCTAADSMRTPETGEVLKYKPALAAMPTTGGAEHSVDGTNAPFDVVLDVAIGGAFQNPANKRIYSIGCDGSGCTNAPLPTRVGKSKVLTSNAGTGVSFADVFATEDNTSNPKLAGLKIAGFLVAATLSNISNLSTLGFTGESEDRYIYINAGIHKDNTAYLNINPNKVFTETLTFTLINAF